VVNIKPVIVTKIKIKKAGWKLCVISKILLIIIVVILPSKIPQKKKNTMEKPEPTKV